MEQGDFERRRREQMIEKGEYTPPLELTAADKIEMILNAIDTIIHPQAQSNETPYNVQIRQHLDTLREEGETDDQIYDDLINQHLGNSPSLLKAVVRRTDDQIDLPAPHPNTEFDH